MDLLADDADRTAARAFAADALRQNVQEAAAGGASSARSTRRRRGPATS